MRTTAKKQSTQINAAWIAASATVLAALISACVPKCNRTDAEPSAIARHAVATANAYDGRIFRPCDPYPAQLGTLRLGMRFSAFRALGLGGQREFMPDVIELTFSKPGPFKDALVYFTPLGDDPIVKSIDCRMQDDGLVMRDAIVKLGQNYSLGGLQHEVYAWDVNGVIVEIQPNWLTLRKGDSKPCM